MAEPEGGADLAREIERVSDRLRVLGPRLAARSAEDRAAAGELARLRGVLQDLADLAADAEARRRRPVPALAPHALGDQVLVLGHDLLAVDDPAARSAGLAALTALRRSL